MGEKNPFKNPEALRIFISNIPKHVCEIFVDLE